MPLAITATESTVTTFWNSGSASADVKRSAKGAGRGWAAMRRTCSPLADRALRACLDWWDANQPAAFVVLKAQAGSTDPAVRSLAFRAAQVEGRLVRLTDPASPRARFARAKRPPRPTRFLRDLPVVH